MGIICPDRNGKREERDMTQEKEGDNQTCHATTYSSKVKFPIFPVKVGIF